MNAQLVSWWQKTQQSYEWNDQLDEVYLSHCDGLPELQAIKIQFKTPIIAQLVEQWQETQKSYDWYDWPDEVCLSLCDSLPGFARAC